MAETNGFYFPDRCYNCVFIHAALDYFDRQVAKNEERTTGLIEELTILDGAMNPDQPLSESSRRIIARRQSAAASIVEGLRLKRQGIFDTAEYYCQGTEPVEDGELAPCRLTPSLEQSQQQLRQHRQA